MLIIFIIVPSTTSVSVNHISVKPIYDYLELDNIEVEPPRRYANCRGAKNVVSVAICYYNRNTKSGIRIGSHGIQGMI